MTAVSFLKPYTMLVVPTGRLPSALSPCFLPARMRTPTPSAMRQPLPNENLRHDMSLRRRARWQHSDWPVTERALAPSHGFASSEIRPGRRRCMLSATVED